MAQPLWRPSAERIAQANLTKFTRAVAARHGGELADPGRLQAWSVAQPDAFWAAVWDFTGVVASRPAERVLVDGERMPGARWFPGATLNFAENLLRCRGHQLALIALAEDGVRREFSFHELHAAVAACAAALRRDGVGPGDRVAAILPHAPEAVIAMLAATALGAIWSSCSPDFGVQGVLDRFGQIEPKVLIAASGWRSGGQWTDNSAKILQIRAQLPSVERLVLVPPSGTALPAPPSAAIAWADYLAAPTGPLSFAQLPFDHPVYVLYSSGTTGVPKPIVHGAGGTLLQHLKELALHTDVGPADRLFYLTTCGWMMWNWQVSGLALGATLVMYDGSPFYPDGGRLLDLAEKERITVFGTSAKYLDTLKKSGLTPATSHDLGALRTILSTGSPLAPETFDFVYERVKSDVHLASISGGTDIVSCFVLGNPTQPVWRGEIQGPGLGMAVEVFDQSGRPVAGRPGELVCTRPFPSMPVGFWNDPDGARYRRAYFERFAGVWHHGDLIERTARGGFVIHGRSDATLNPGGVRIGTGEIYRQVEQIDEVAEAVAVGQEWQGDTRIVLFARLRQGAALDERLRAAIRQRLLENCSAHHVPAKILAVADIPRTRSNKIAELAVRDVIHGRPVANLHALANPEALELYRELAELGFGEPAPYTAPRDAIEERLAGIWRGALGLAEVGIDDDYYERGGNSLTGLEMFLEIEDTFGCALPLGLLVASPTIRALARAIHEGAGPAPCLVPLQAAGTRPPLFCIHDLSGNVLVYRRLAAHLGPEQPVYGLQYPDQHVATPPAHSIEALASRYLDEIVTAYPEGPYNLVGYSVGGLIAFEMARQLDARGGTVALLASLDGGTPDYPPQGPVKLLDQLIELLHHNPLAWPAYLQRRAGYRRARRGRALTGYPSRAGLDGLSPTVRAIATELLPAARAGYRPQPYPGAMTVLRCAEDRFLWRRRPRLGWDRYALGGVTVLDVPATHQALMVEPAVSALARTLAGCLERQRSVAAESAQLPRPAISTRGEYGWV